MYNATTSNFALCNKLYHLESKQGIQFLENGRINGVIHCASPQDGSHSDEWASVSKNCIPKITLPLTSKYSDMGPLTVPGTMDMECITICKN